MIKVIAGKGIIFNNDSILLGSTTIPETRKILDIETDSDFEVIGMELWSGYDTETGESVSGIDYVKEIEYKSILIRYSDTIEDGLKLSSISIKPNKSFKIYTDTGIELHEPNPDIKILYPLDLDNDYESDNKLTYNIFSHGISFYLNKLDNQDTVIKEIAIHGVITD